MCVNVKRLCYHITKTVLIRGGLPAYDLSAKVCKLLLSCYASLTDICKIWLFLRVKPALFEIAV